MFSDPCFGKECDGFSTCVALSDDSTVCKCRHSCLELEETHFCGTDGRTYDYPCGDGVKTCVSSTVVPYRYLGGCGEC